MKNHFFIFLLAVYLLVFFVLIFSVDTSYMLETPEGQYQRLALWSSASKARVFFALQVLFGSLLFSFLGFLTMFVFWSPSRFLWLLGFSGLLLYYRLDPRYSPGDAIYLFRGILLFLFGAITERLFFRAAETRRRSPLIDTLIILSGYCLSMIVARLFSNFALDERLSISLPQLSVTLLLFLSGVIAHSSFFGGARDLFEAEPWPPLFRFSFARKYIAFSFALAVLLLMGATFYRLDIPALPRLGWTLASPFIPLFMSVYSPFTWFAGSAEGASFGSELMSSSGVLDGRARLFLGMFFQYLTLVTIAAIVVAVRRVRSMPLIIAGHLMLVLYWLPTLWFAERLAQLYQ